MLDSETKRRIDTARDILVGKVPDPKSQVEQITIALIYKFMNDMDAENAALGGERSFFKGDFEKYGWTRLMAPNMGGFDVLNLYSESIQKMNENPNVPQLFRDIFKNAFLPYRNPETLKSFLKVINDFQYDHSERLGDAFEYLLSVLGSQGGAGQFRTPRNIIDFMVEVADPKKTDSMLDPACGTAGFLISAYKHILKHNSSSFRPDKDKEAFDEKGVKIEELTLESPLHYKGDKLSPEDKGRLFANIKGYDISPDMVRLSLVNMYLHGFPDPHIFEYDTLSSEDRWNESYDVIIANPPFMSPKGGIKPHKRFSIQAKRSEVLFVDYIAEHLTPTGKAAVIVPEGIIFKSDTAYKQLRKMLVGEYLYAVVSLPAGVFNPYAGVKTSILLMDRELAKKSDNILFVKIENDGFDLGAQRRPIDKNDLPQAVKAIREYKENLVSGEAFDAEKWKNVLVVERERIGKNGEYNLSGDRYKSEVIIETTYKMAELGGACEINPKKSLIQNLDGKLEVSFVPMADINGNRIHFKAKERRSLEEVFKGYTYFENEDVLLAKVTPCFENGKAGIARNLSNGIGFGSSEFYVFRKTDRILPEWIYYNITSDKFRNDGKLHMTGTGGLQRVPKDFINNFKIPLPPIEGQKEIVAEIESYQKIIDGARQVVENYKPQIPIDPEWEIVKLEEYINFISGLTLSIPKSEKQGGVPIISMNSITKDGVIVEEGIREIELPSKKNIQYLKKGDLLFNWRNGSKHLVGKTGYFDFDGSYVFASFLLGIRVKPEYFDSKFLWYLLNNYRTDGKYMNFMRQNVNGLFNREELKILKVPLPDLDEQTKIVAQFEKEQELVNANKELIEIFEQKIKDKIASVWGEVK